MGPTDTWGAAFSAGPQCEPQPALQWAMLSSRWDASQSVPRAHAGMSKTN